MNSTSVQLEQEHVAASIASDPDAALSTARAVGAAAELHRITSIINCDAGKCRPATALKLALSPNLPAATAELILAGLPIETHLSPHVSGPRAQDCAGGLAVVDASPSSLDELKGDDFARGAAIARGQK